MPESNKPFVITDRRKFTKEGELRPDAPHPAAADDTQVKGEPAAAPTSTPTASAASTPPPAASAPSAPTTLFQTASPAPEPDMDEAELEQGSLPAPTAEQTQQSRFAYEATADRIDTAIRSADPGGNHPPPMNFDQLVQSIYLTAIMQLGGATPEGEKPRIDILGARQSIDMLAVVGDKSKGNLTDGESKLLESALFELRMAFLEITQALARSAQAQGAPGSGPRPAGGPKPGIIV